MVTKNGFIMLLIMLLLFGLSANMKNKLPGNEKKSIFECGFDPNHEKRNSFSLRFFLMTIIFLLFDLEITFILPTPIQLKSLLSANTLMIHFFIIFFFVSSTYLEWKQGALSWFW